MRAGRVTLSVARASFVLAVLLSLAILAESRSAIGRVPLSSSDVPPDRRQSLLARAQSRRQASLQRQQLLRLRENVQQLRQQAQPVNAAPQAANAAALNAGGAPGGASDSMVTGIDSASTAYEFQVGFLEREVDIIVLSRFHLLYLCLAFTPGD